MDGGAGPSERALGKGPRRNEGNPLTRHHPCQPQNQGTLAVPSRYPEAEHPGPPSCPAPGLPSRPRIIPNVLATLTAKTHIIPAAVCLTHDVSLHRGPLDAGNTNPANNMHAPTHSADIDLVMTEDDAGKLTREALFECRKQAIRLHREGMARVRIAAIVGVHRNTVGQWIAKWEGKASRVTMPGKAGRPHDSMPE